MNRIADAGVQEMTRKRREVSAYERGKHVFGKHGSGRDDLSSVYKSEIAELLDAKHHRRRRAAHLGKAAPKRGGR